MKADHALVSALVLVMIGFTLGVALDEKRLGEASAFLPAVATLFAAFLGPFLAYQLEVNRRRREKHQRNRAAANKTVLMLARQWNALKNIQDQSINPHRLDPAYSLNMQPILVHDLDHLEVDVDSLAFLVELDKPQLLFEIAEEQERFRLARTVIKKRFDLHLNEIQPVLERKGATMDKVCTRQEIKTMLGERLFESARQAADHLIIAVDLATNGLLDIGQELSRTVANSYPGETVIRFDGDRQQPPS